MSLPLNQMTIEEKLKAMELLWDDICRNVPEITSPKWHGDELQKREERLRQGKENFMDWDQTKKDIRNEVA